MVQENMETLFIEFCEWLVDFPIGNNDNLREGQEIYHAIEFFNDYVLDGGGVGLNTWSKYILSTVEYTAPSLFLGIRLNPWIFFENPYAPLLVCLSSYTESKYNKLYRIFLSQKKGENREKDFIIKKMKKSFHIQIVELNKYIAEDGFIEHRAIVKTHWICIIQRHWKKIVAERKQILLKRGSLKEQQSREICGNYSFGIRGWPGLKGMLACYNKE